MNQQRAQYILRNMRYGSPRFAFAGVRGGGTLTFPDGITLEEDAYIRRAWKKLDGRSCYMSVIYAIARGANFLVSDVNKVDYFLNSEIPWDKLA
jgi:hypothetical protein